MAKDLKNLFDYQTEDQKLYNLEKEYAQDSFRKEYYAKYKFYKAGKDTDSAYEVKAKALADDYTALTEQLKALLEEKNQFDNSVKEVADDIAIDYLSNQINTVIAKIDKLKSDIEETNKQIIQLLSDYSAFVKEYKQAKEFCVNNQEKFKEKDNKFKEAKEEIIKVLEEKAKAVPPDLLTIYKTKREDKISVPIIYLCTDDGGFCAYCRQEISGKQKEQLDSHEIVECENCRKLLYKE